MGTACVSSKKSTNMKKSDHSQYPEDISKY